MPKEAAMELPVTLTPSLTLLAILLAACIGLLAFRSDNETEGEPS